MELVTQLTIDYGNQVLEDSISWSRKQIEIQAAIIQAAITVSYSTSTYISRCYFRVWFRITILSNSDIMEKVLNTLRFYSWKRKVRLHSYFQEAHPLSKISCN